MSDISEQKKQYMKQLLRDSIKLMAQINGTSERDAFLQALDENEIEYVDLKEKDS